MCTSNTKIGSQTRVSIHIYRLGQKFVYVSTFLLFLTGHELFLQHKRSLASSLLRDFFPFLLDIWNKNKKKDIFVINGKIPTSRQQGCTRRRTVQYQNPSLVPCPPCTFTSLPPFWVAKEIVVAISRLVSLRLDALRNASPPVSLRSIHVSSGHTIASFLHSFFVTTTFFFQKKKDCVLPRLHFWLLAQLADSSTWPTIDCLNL